MYTCYVQVQHLKGARYFVLGDNLQSKKKKRKKNLAIGIKTRHSYLPASHFSSAVTFLWLNYSNICDPDRRDTLYEFKRGVLFKDRNMKIEKDWKNYFKK